MVEVSPLIRAAVIVADLDKSVAFYRDILGYEEVFFSGGLDDPVVNELLGTPDTSHTRATILKRAGPAVGMLGLFEVTQPAPPRLDDTGRGCRIGQVCMVFYCADLDEICGKLVAHNARVISGPKVLNIKGRPGQANREMTFLGPDGELLNFIERDPIAAL